MEAETPGLSSTPGLVFGSPGLPAGHQPISSCCPTQLQSQLPITLKRAKLPAHALRKDSQEVENWTSPSPTHPGFCLSHWEERGWGGEGSKGTSRWSGRTVWGVAVPKGASSPLYPYRTPKALQRQEYSPCFKTMSQPQTCGSSPPHAHTSS